MSQFFRLMRVFRQSGGRVSKLGIKLVLGNLAVTGLVVALVFSNGRFVSEVDWIDALFESGSFLIQFFLFSMVAFAHLKRRLKYIIMLGLLLLQNGIMLDFLDEFIFIDSVLWHRVGDVSFFLGMLLMAFGISGWLILSYEMSTMDKLTKVHNRRFFESYLNLFLLEVERTGKPACLMNLDLDNFKQINDKFGHAKGDSVLRTVAEVLKESIRKYDVICRSGGEEFEVLLVNASLNDAPQIAQRVLECMAASTPAGLPKVSASIGIAQVSKQDSSDSLRRRADDAMYRAKRNGKAQYVLAESGLSA